jgi:hypothetical protein
MNKIKTAKAEFRERKKQKRTSTLFARLLQMLVRCSGIATTEEIEEVLNQIREVNDSVEIVARHLKRQADDQSAPPPAPLA